MGDKRHHILQYDPPPQDITNNLAADSDGLGSIDIVDLQQVMKN